MSIQELIKNLQRCEPNAEVWISSRKDFPNSAKSKEIDGVIAEIDADNVTIVYK